MADNSHTREGGVAFRVAANPRWALAGVILIALGTFLLLQLALSLHKQRTEWLLIDRFHDPTSAVWLKLGTSWAVAASFSWDSTARPAYRAALCRVLVNVTRFRKPLL